MKIPIVSIVVFLSLACQAATNIYSWTDKNGVKHFSNDPPPKDEQVTNLIVMKVSEDEPDSAAVRSAAPANTSPKADTTNKKVEIYIDPASEYCIQAMSFFDQNKIPYIKHDLTSSQEEVKKFENLNGRDVPLIFINEERMDGWNEQQVRQLLNK